MYNDMSNNMYTAMYNDNDFTTACGLAGIGVEHKKTYGLTGLGIENGAGSEVERQADSLHS